MDATGGQEQRFARAFRLLDEAIARQVFPGASLAVTLGGELLAWRGFGRFTYEADSPEVDARDGVGSGIADQANCDDLDGNAAVGAREAGARCEGCGVAAGVRGRSESAARVARGGDGADAAGAFLRAAGTSQAVSGGSGTRGGDAAAMRVPLETAPGTRAEYSDIGFILLGELLERIAGERLEYFVSARFLIL